MRSHEKSLKEVHLNLSVRSPVNNDGLRADLVLSGEVNPLSVVEESLNIGVSSYYYYQYCQRTWVAQKASLNEVLPSLVQTLFSGVVLIDWGL